MLDASPDSPSLLCAHPSQAASEHRADNTRTPCCERSLPRQTAPPAELGFCARWRRPGPSPLESLGWWEEALPGESSREGCCAWRSGECSHRRIDLLLRAVQPGLGGPFDSGGFHCSGGGRPAAVQPLL